jgi:hypothetical protein
VPPTSGNRVELSQFSTASQSELFDTDSEGDPAQSQQIAVRFKPPGSQSARTVCVCTRPQRGISTQLGSLLLSVDKVLQQTFSCNWLAIKRICKMSRLATALLATVLFPAAALADGSPSVPPITGASGTASLLTRWDRCRLLALNVIRGAATSCLKLGDERTSRDIAIR